MNVKTKIIAMYFTQLHAIAENDAWWGEGFTDWVNVRRAEPLFEGHYQPRVPKDADYYDQSRLETIKSQVELARKYGIYGFCHYHYWFDGKQLLETPTNLFLENRDIDFPFCLSWANETWSRRWDGRDHDILIRQTHPPSAKSWSRHFEYLIKAWRDERAIKINGKPVFVIYRPQKIEKIDEMLDFWEAKARASGLQGLYYIFQKQYEPADKSCLRRFDASFQFQPFEAINSAGYSSSSQKKQKLRTLIDKAPHFMQRLIWSIYAKRKRHYLLHDYDRVWEQVIRNCRNSPDNVFPGAFVDWDNTARYGNRSTIITGASPDKFRAWLTRLQAEISTRPVDMRYIFLNAWNEWAECAYIEPDERYGYAYLEAIRNVLTSN